MSAKETWRVQMLWCIVRLCIEGVFGQSLELGVVYDGIPMVVLQLGGVCKKLLVVYCMLSVHQLQ
jgi:hypothetical protein